MRAVDRPATRPAAARKPLVANSGVLERIGGRGRGLAALAVVVGIGSGLGAIAFRYLIREFTRLFAGHANLGAHPHVVAPWLAPLGAGCVVAAPVIGGLIYGPLIARFAPEARGHGVPEVMLAVSRAGGRIRPRVALVKSFASAICIGSGGSVGREGPIVQVGSALGSAIGQLARMPERRIRLLVACGAAGGIAATFNAPIAGVFFALEVILRDFEAESFAVVVLSSVTAAAIGRAAFGSAAFLVLPHFGSSSALDFALFALLGLLAAAVALAFVRTLYATEDLADRLWRGPQWLRPAVGGIALGGLLLVLPEMYGVGYPVLEAAVREHYVLALLVLLMIGKIAATSLTIAIGGSGGVFAPSLFIGSMLGSAFGQVAHGVAPGIVGAPGAYGLVGMAAVFAAGARAPITAVLIVFELSGDYALILPLMVAVGVASGVAGLITRDSIYTLKLRRRGIDVAARRPAGPMHSTTVRDAMRPVPRSVPAEAPIAGLVGRLASGSNEAIPVVAEKGDLVGVLSADDLDAALADGQRAAAAGDVARGVPKLRADQSLDVAARALADSDEPALPVLDADGRTVIGWIGHRDVLRAYRRSSGAAAARPPRRRRPPKEVRPDGAELVGPP